MNSHTRKTHDRKVSAAEVRKIKDANRHKNLDFIPVYEK